MVIEVRKGEQSQTVLLRNTGAGLHWFWVWESSDGGFEYDRALPAGQEREFARRIAGVLSIPKVGS
ncbi:hypothetical protein [Nocardiopsis sp. Huas11]|uniref:hypothetical protein n=1 Tax=Nocardiopsis sp. Huas11 TaxID=2183912 RepID=UPI000EB4D20D|nr:hypothetical protein [Nocardiopsis sp. Huas11]